MRGSRPDRLYLCINRTRFMDRRADQKEELLAPLQAELAPDEAAFGILRDAGARRSVMASPMFFASLRHTWDKMAPKAWNLFCREWGTKWGRLAVVDLETEALEATGKTMRDLSMRDAVSFIADYLTRHGWGRLQVDFSPADDAGAFVIGLARNGLAEAVGTSEVPRCELLAGFFAAVFSHLAYKVIVVREVCCKTQGFAQCQFVAVAAPRKQVLGKLLAENDGDVARTLAGLKEDRHA